MTARAIIVRSCVALGLAGLCATSRAKTASIDEARQSLAEVTAKQDAVTALVGANRSQLSRILGALQLFGRDPPPALLVDPADATDAVRAAILIRAIVPELQARAHRLGAQALALAAIRHQVAAAEGELFAAESEVQDRASRLEDVASDADSLIPPDDRAARAAIQRGAAPKVLLPPAKGGEMIRAFGARLPGGGRSLGVAMQTPAGASVQAPASGIVDYAGPLEGWGRVVILGAGGGYHLVVSGLAVLLVSPGQKVAPGQILGVMAQGGAAPPQLYFELRQGDEPIDPAPLMGAALVKAPLLRRKVL